MRIYAVDNSIERRLVTGMVVSDKFLKEVLSIYRPELIEIPFARTVAEWCVEYHKKYEKAPGRHIQDIYDDASARLPDAQSDLIEDFLAGLSDEWEHAEAGKFNVDYLLDETEKRFQSRALKMLSEDVDALLQKGAVAEAEHLRSEFKPPMRPSSLGVDPLTDEALIMRALDNVEGDELFRLPGALGQLVGPIVREDFIGIMGPEKRGKSWRLLDFAMRAFRAKCNVAYFDAGDNSEVQATRRIHTYNTRRSIKYSGPSKSPVLDCAHNQTDACRKRERRCSFGVMQEVNVKGTLKWERKKLEDAPNYVPCIYCMKEEPQEYKGAVWHEMINVEQLTAAVAIEEGKRATNRSRKRFKLSCHPNSTLTVAEMDSTLRRWKEDEDFVPDVIVVDYFDIFAPEDPKARLDERHKQNVTWKAGRKLSQEWHCAVITATQADADSYDQHSLKESNFSESKSKYAHVTRILTLNQSPEEKADGIMRIGTMFVRESDFSVDHHVSVLQNLRIGQPLLGSF